MCCCLGMNTCLPFILDCRSLQCWYWSCCSCVCTLSKICPHVTNHLFKQFVYVCCVSHRVYSISSLRVYLQNVPRSVDGLGMAAECATETGVKCFQCILGLHLGDKVVKQFTIVLQSFLGKSVENTDDQVHNYTRALCHLASIVCLFIDAWNYEFIMKSMWSVAENFVCSTSTATFFNKYMSISFSLMFHFHSQVFQ